MGQLPSAATFHRFARPVSVVLSSISLPSGDQAASKIWRVKNRSSTGTGLALEFCAEVTDLGSVICRSFGPDAANVAPRSSRQRKFRTFESPLQHCFAL